MYIYIYLSVYIYIYIYIYTFSYLHITDYIIHFHIWIYKCCCMKKVFVKNSVSKLKNMYSLLFYFLDYYQTIANQFFPVHSSGYIS